MPEGLGPEGLSLDGFGFPGRLVLCFLLGSIPFASIAMWGSGVDITRFGSQNPGFNNVLRYSRWRAMICLIGDAGKGFLAVWLCYRATEAPWAVWAYGVAAVAGHCFSPFLSFRGGKGVATAAGVMLFMYPKVLLPCVASYLILRAIGAKLQWTERGTVASISSGCLFVVLLMWMEGLALAAPALVLLLFVVWRHRKNFQVLTRAQSRQ